MNHLTYALIVAVIARVITREELFYELREWARGRKTPVTRKLAYPLTCPFCFSFWVSLVLTLALITRHPLDVAITTFVLVGLSNALQIVYELVTVVMSWLRARTERENAETVRVRFMHQQRKSLTNGELAEILNRIDTGVRS